MNTTTNTNTTTTTTNNNNTTHNTQHGTARHDTTKHSGAVLEIQQSRLA
jgi:hypothetical protein